MIILLFILITFNGCIEGFGSDNRYDGKRPFDYGSAKWVCEEPSGWFIVDENTEDYHAPKGEFEFDGKVVLFELSFIVGTNMVLICSLNSDALTGEQTTGDCEFSPEKLIIKIDPEKDALFNGEYDTLTFIKAPIE
ncbi:MAG: hypothetical protein GX896_07180 [Clostridiales bacterium]|nr:hypothetical protein [Clostridiales bacterium]